MKKPSVISLCALLSLASTSLTSPRLYITNSSDCAGNDIGPIGKDRRCAGQSCVVKSMEECVGLCQKQQTCVGFVLDAIPTEIEGQCGAMPGTGELCCLLKSQCLVYQHKSGDTAVSFVEPPPAGWQI